MALLLKCIESEKEALFSQKHGSMDPHNRLSSWGSHENQQECCSREGLHCRDRTGGLVKLDLSNQGMISPSLAELIYFNYLDLCGNYFSDVPKSFGSLAHLKYLNLANANLEEKLHMNWEICFACCILISDGIDLVVKFLFSLLNYNA